VAVYKRGYQRYQGPLTSHPARLLVLPRFAWRRLFEQRLLIVLLIVSLFWPLACAVFIYLANHSELWAGLDREVSGLLEINGRFFLTFMNVQAVLAVVLAAFAGPSLVAPDLANNALPLYFSRPLSRTDYALARMAVLAGLLSPVTWIPGLLLFAMQAGMAGWTWLASYWTLAIGLFAGFLFLILQLALVSLACSAYVKWRAIAGALILAFFFVLAGVAETIDGVLRVTWGAFVNPLRMMYRLWCELLGVAPPENPGLAGSIVMLLILVLILVWVLSRKLRPVEVVS